MESCCQRTYYPRYKNATWQPPTAATSPASVGCGLVPSRLSPCQWKNTYLWWQRMPEPFWHPLSSFKLGRELWRYKIFESSKFSKPALNKSHVSWTSFSRSLLTSYYCHIQHQQIPKISTTMTTSTMPCYHQQQPTMTFLPCRHHHQPRPTTTAQKRAQETRRLLGHRYVFLSFFYNILTTDYQAISVARLTTSSPKKWKQRQGFETRQVSSPGMYSPIHFVYISHNQPVPNQT